MYTTRIDQQIQQWYSEVKERSNGPQFLLIDECGGHFSTQDLPRVRIEKLIKHTACQFQPLDQELIAQSKIRYRSLLLIHTCEIAEEKSSSNHSFRNDSAQNLRFVRRTAAHVAETIQLFDDSWNQKTKAAILKYQIKSKSL